MDLIRGAVQVAVLEMVELEAKRREAIHAGYHIRDRVVRSQVPTPLSPDTRTDPWLMTVSRVPTTSSIRLAVAKVTPRQINHTACRRVLHSSPAAEKRCAPTGPFIVRCCHGCASDATEPAHVAPSSRAATRAGCGRRRWPRSGSSPVPGGRRDVRPADVAHVGRRLGFVAGVACHRRIRDCARPDRRPCRDQRVVAPAYPRRVSRPDPRGGSAAHPAAPILPAESLASSSRIAHGFRWLGAGSSRPPGSSRAMNVFDDRALVVADPSMAVPSGTTTLTYRALRHRVEGGPPGVAAHRGYPSARRRDAHRWCWQRPTPLCRLR